MPGIHSDCPPDFLGGSFDDFYADLPAARVHAMLQKSLIELQRAEKCAVLWFAEIAARKLFLELGYASVHQYAAEALGFSRNKTYHFLRLAADLERLPVLRESVANGEVGWTKAREVVKVASAENERQWVDVARASSRRELVQKVVLAKQRSTAKRSVDPAQIELPAVASGAAATRPTAGGVVPEQRSVVVVEVAPELQPDAMIKSTDTTPAADAPVAVTFRLTPLQLARFESLVETIHKTGRVPRGASRAEVLLAALDELVASESGVDENVETTARESCDQQVLPRRNSSSNRPTSNCRVIIHKCETCNRATVQTNQGEKRIGAAEIDAAECDAVIQREGKRNTSTIPPSVRHVVLARDRYRCQSTGCSNTRFLEIHHVIPRARGGSNRKENLTTLCSRCHTFRHRQQAGIKTVTPIPHTDTP